VSGPRQPLLVAGSGTQWDDALRIADALEGRARVLHLGRLDVGPAPPPGTPYGGTHWPEQGVRATAALLHGLRDEVACSSAVVLGQDAGRMTRIVARAARRTSRPVAVVPDGALFVGAPSLRVRERLEERALLASGLSTGRPLEFGSTHPDLWCAWGPGWEPMLRTFSPRGRVVVTGSPRAADLATVPTAPGRGRVLVCSQPTWVHPFPPSATAGPRWYRWLEHVVATAADSVTVRLHPREREEIDALPLGPATRAVVTPPGPLADDLAGADVVVAPFSTVLLEAAAAGRTVVSVVPERACVGVRTMSPAMADARLRVLVVDEVASVAALVELAEPLNSAGWGEDFCVVDRAAPARCAQALLDLAPASASVRA